MLRREPQNQYDPNAVQASPLVANFIRSSLMVGAKRKQHSSRPHSSSGSRQTSRSDGHSINHSRRTGDWAEHRSGDALQARNGPISLRETFS